MCSFADCDRPSDGVLAIATAHGTVRVSACEEHGRRVVDGERFPVDLQVTPQWLDGGGALPANYEPRPR